MTKDARRYVLKRLCTPLQRDGWPRPKGKRALVGQSTEYPGIEQHDVEYQLTSLLRAGYLRELDEETVVIHPTGVEEYESMTGERIQLHESFTDLLECLDEHDTPEKPGVARTIILQELDLPEKRLDRIVWFLEERGDLTTVSGRRDSFLTARLTADGRAKLE